MAFREKPDPEIAEAFVRDGDHYWNSGLFCARAEVFLDQYEAHLPQMRRVHADLEFVRRFHHAHLAFLELQRACELARKFL